MAVKKTAAKSTKKTFKSKLPSVKDPLTKSGFIKAIVDMTGLGKKEVTSVLDALGTVIELHIKSRGPQKFVLPGLLKIQVIKKAAKPAREGINPFTGEKMMFKAKPAHKVVKVKPLRKLKEMAE